MIPRKAHRMRDIVERLREKPCRYAYETEDQSKIRRQRERDEAADLIEHLRERIETAHESRLTDADAERLPRCV